MKVRANFEYNSRKCEILCQSNQTMEDICKKFANKFEEDFNQLNFKINGELINLKLKFLDLANKDSNKIDLLVEKKNISTNSEMTFTTPPPKLNNISPENDSSYTQCLNTEINPCQSLDTQINNISQEIININENTQIQPQNDYSHGTNDLLKLSDEEAKKKIRYKEKDCLCNKHCDERYIYYCQNCGIDLCAFCENEHIGHEFVKFNQIITIDDANIIKNKLKEKEVLKNEFVDKLESIIKFFKKILNKVKVDYEITEEFVNNFKFIYRNIEVIELLIKAKQNYSFFDDINQIMENRNIIFNKIENLINIINTNKFEELIYNNNNINNDNINNDDMNSNNNIIEELINQDRNKFSEILQNLVKIYQNSFKNQIHNEVNELINNATLSNFTDFNQNLNYVLPNNINYDQKEILLEYKIDGEKNIKLFGEEFVNKNKDLFIEYNYQHIELKSEMKIESLENNSDKLEIKIKALDNINSIKGMFYECDSLRSVKGLEHININELTDLSDVFYGCKSLIHLSDISEWDTSNITNMSNIFYGCSSLETIPDISNWNTGKLKKMDKMFYGCSSLKALPDISKWNTSNVNDISYLFCNCTSLESLPDISIWNISNVKSLNGIFKGCCSLKTLPDISKWDISKVINMDYLFRNCSALEEIPDISDWNTSKVKTLKELFYGCRKLKIINALTNWDASNFGDISYLFYDCSELEELPNLSKWSLKKVKDMSFLFAGCMKLYNSSSLFDWNKEIKNKECKKYIKSFKDLFN